MNRFLKFKKSPNCVGGGGEGQENRGLFPLFVTFFVGDPFLNVIVEVPIFSKVKVKLLLSGYFPKIEDDQILLLKSALSYPSIVGFPFTSLVYENTNRGRQRAFFTWPKIFWPSIHFLRTIRLE